MNWQSHQECKPSKATFNPTMMKEPTQPLQSSYTPKHCRQVDDEAYSVWIKCHLFIWRALAKGLMETNVRPSAEFLERELSIFKEVQNCLLVFGELRSEHAISLAEP